ncbi:unnamed protein product [Orchesella dallaii]|uniref:Uncharacterized protein n=1 Tax=Orchesella dallaii TaxID=48710 RepID=A0ABP1QQ68_9HEXA
MSCNRTVARPATFDNLTHIVRRLEETGFLQEFLRVYPHHALAVETTRANIIQNARGYQGGIGSRQQQYHVGSAAIPSASSLRFFVNLIAQLLEEQCPNRADLTCEDRCLAAIQSAISDCLKIVRHNQGCPGCDACDTPANRQAQQVSYSKHMQNAITAGPVPFTLAKKLDSIPEPTSCPRPKYVTLDTKNSCGVPKTRNSGKHMDKACDFPPPVAGEYSDGVGGFKIKCFPAHTNDVAPNDGMGGRKAKGIED